MSGSLPYALLGVFLFGAGIAALAWQPHLIRKIMAANVMASGIFLLLAGGARRAPEGPDPVPQAMALTGIVVALAVSVFAMGLARRVHLATGEWTLPEDVTRE